MTGFKTVVRREIWRFMKIPSQTLIPPIISSIIFIVIFGRLLGDRLQGIVQVSYLEFAIPGLIMMAIIDNAYANNSSSVFMAKFLKYIEDLLITPTPYIHITLAYMIGGVVRSLLTAGAIIIVSLFFTSNLFLYPFLVILMLVLGSMIFSLLGSIIGLWATNFDKLHVWNTFLITPLVFFGGVFHSLSLLPPVIQKISLFNPIFYLVDGLRYAMIGISDASIFLDISVTLAILVIVFFWNVYLFKTGYRLKD